MALCGVDLGILQETKVTKTYLHMVVRRVHGSCHGGSRREIDLSEVEEVVKHGPNIIAGQVVTALD